MQSYPARSGKMVILALSASVFHFWPFDCASAHAVKSPIEIVKALIRPYLNDNASPPDDDAELLKIGSPELVDLIWTDLACRIENQQICGLDFDPIIWAQDYQIRNLKIHSLPQRGEQQSVKAYFLNGGRPTNIRYDFVNINGRWHLNDITNLDPAEIHKTMKQYLRDNY